MHFFSFSSIEEKITSILEPICPSVDQGSRGSITFGSSGSVNFKSNLNGTVGKPFEIKYICELAEPCEDLKGEKWCEKRKKKGKCKKKYYKKCQKTCEQCWSKSALFFQNYIQIFMVNNPDIYYFFVYKFAQNSNLMINN